MPQECTITLDDEQYQLFQDIVDNSEFDSVGEYIERLTREYYEYHSTTDQAAVSDTSDGRDLDSHLEALGYK